MPAAAKAPHAPRQLASVNTPGARNNLPLSWLTQSARGRAYGPPQTPTPMLRATNTIARRSTISASCGDSRNPPTQRRCTVNACTPPLLRRCCYTRDRTHILAHTSATATISIIRRGTIPVWRLTSAATRPTRMQTTTMRRCSHLRRYPRVHAK